MLDIKFVRDNPDAVKENIKKKFQDAKLPLVDEVIEKDAKYRECLKEVESLKAARNKLSKANGPLFGQLKKCTDEAQKAQLQAQIDANNAAVKADADKMAELEAEEAKLADRIQEIMYTIPQMIDPSVPIGPDDTYNVEAQRFGEPVVPDFPIPYHTEIMESFDGIDMDAAGRVAGNGFYYLLGNIARLHEAVLAYARDFMIDMRTSSSPRANTTPCATLPRWRSTMRVSNCLSGTIASDNGNKLAILNFQVKIFKQADLVDRTRIIHFVNML